MPAEESELANMDKFPDGGDVTTETSKSSRAASPQKPTTAAGAASSMIDSSLVGARISPKDKIITVSDIQQFITINHFQKLMHIFDEHMKAGNEGFDLAKFQEVFSKLLKKNFSPKQLELLFIKIDANSDGTITWDEFSSYMMLGTISVEDKILVVEQQSKKFMSQPGMTSRPHKDMVIRIDYISKERKYLSMSRDGIVCLWNTNMILQKIIDTKDFAPNSSWVTDAMYLHDHLKLVAACDDRKLYVYDVMSLKPRLLAVIGPMEHVPMCLDYSAHMDEHRDLLVWGDDGGCINLLYFNKRFFVDNVTEDRPAFVDIDQLSKKENQIKYHMHYIKRKCHTDWVYSIKYYQELNSIVSCSADPHKTLVISDIERLPSQRFVRIQRGIRCFTVSYRPSFLITGGRDRLIRLWNPYVLTKPAGSLIGHNATVVQLSYNNISSQIISASEDKVIKIWSSKTMQCLQTLTDRMTHRPDNTLTALFWDSINKRLLAGHEFVEEYEIFKPAVRSLIVKSHDSPLVTVIYNRNFNQIMSVAVESEAKLWEVNSGQKLNVFMGLHDDLEVTCAMLDNSGRRLMTGSRNGCMRLWNFSNGQLIQQMYTNNRSEIMDLLHVEANGQKHFVCVGWDRKISLFETDPGNMSTLPVRVLTGEFMGINRGHTDDILCVAFCQPNLLATGSVNGKIVLWSHDLGHVRGSMEDPILNIRSPEEKAVEKVFFMRHEVALSVIVDGVPNPPLISCHADGHLRFWNPRTQKMLYEFCCQIEGNEGVSCISASQDGTLLLVGDTFGNVRVFDIANFKIHPGKYDYAVDLRFIAFYRAHARCVVSVQYLDEEQIVITASKDGSVRLWTLTGKYIGSLGQSEKWDFGDPESWSSPPSDITQNQDAEKRSAMIGVKLAERRVQMKKRVVNRIKLGTIGVNEDFIDLCLLELKKELNSDDIDPDILKSRVIMKAVARKWKEFTVKNRGKAELRLVKRTQIKNPLDELKFFQFELRKEKTTTTYGQHVKSDSAFHSLQYFNLNQVQLPPKPNNIEKLFMNTDNGIMGGGFKGTNRSSGKTKK